VTAVGSRLVDPSLEQYGDFDTVMVQLKTATGKQCHINNCREAVYGYDQRIEAYCAKGLLRAGNVLSSTVETWSEDGPRSDALQNFFLDRYAGAYRSEMAHFADIMDGATPLVGYRDGIAALAIAEAAMESHLESRAVRIRY